MKEQRNKTSRIQALTVVFILYLFQGVLYGLQVKFLPIALRRKGSSLSFIGSINLLALPWLIKSLWAPIVDLYATTRAWLIGTLTGILTSLFLIHLTQERNLFGLIIVILNIFSATHELVTGKILLCKLNDQQLKTASSYKIFAYKCGSLLGGGAAVSISSIFAITDQMFLIVSAFYLLLLMFTIFLIPENFFEKPKTPVGTRDSQMAFSVPEVEAEKVRYSGLRIFFGQFFNDILRGSKWMITCLAVYKFASHSSHLLFTLALVDQGVRVASIGLMSGVIGHAISLLVAMVIGIMLSQKRFSSIRILCYVSILDVLSVSVQAWIVFCRYAGPVSTSTVFFSFCLQHIVLGAQAIPVFSIVLVLSKREHPRYQATQHSVYTTLDTLGSKLSLLIAGVMADYFGYTFGMCISLAVSIAVVILAVNGPEEDDIERQDIRKKRT